MLGASGDLDLSTLLGLLFRSAPRNASTTTLYFLLAAGTVNCAMRYHHPVVLRTPADRMPDPLDA